MAMDWGGGINTLGAIILLASICPLCALLGYLTPRLIDDYASGQATKAGQAYAINVLGCVLGPLFACYVLLPNLSERYALILLCLPFFIFYFLLCRAKLQWQQLGWGLLAGVVLGASIFFVRDFQGALLRSQKNTIVRRDYTASVISFEDAVSRKWAFSQWHRHDYFDPHHQIYGSFTAGFPSRPSEINIGYLFRHGHNLSFGLSWDIDTTVVELVPSVTKAFGFYHADAEKFINNPNGHIIIDDGRRYLNRCGKKFDVIVVDPPPPVEAAGSSLLFSTDFYTLAKQHLNTNGILQMWFPGGEYSTQQAVLRSIHESFPYVRCFSSIEKWGLHLLASMEPIEQLDPAQLAARIPEGAQKDLLEWNNSKNLTTYLSYVVTNEYSIPLSLNPNPSVQVTDDQPFNEYFLIRLLN